MKCLKCDILMQQSCIDDQGGEDIFVTEWQCPQCGLKELP
jgi:hypothetical protein